MGEIIRILAVKPKQNETRDILKDVSNKLEEKIAFKVINTKINFSPNLDIYDKTVELSLEFLFNERKIEINMDKKTFTDDNIIVDLSIQTEQESNILEDDLYFIKLQTKEVLNDFFKGVYWQKDTQNEKMSSKLYAAIHELENRFREIIVTFMVNKFGFNWTKRFNNKFNDKIQEYSKWYRDNYEDFKSVKTELFNLQINDLILLVQSAYEKQPFSDEVFINSITSDRLNSEEKIELIEDFKSSGQEKNIWEKYFIEILGDDFPDYWEFLRNARNMVAHNKPICTQLLSDTNSNIEKVNFIFDKVGEVFQERFVSHENIEIERLWFEHENDIREEQFDEIYLSDAGIEQTPTEEDIIDAINENEEFQEMNSVAEEYIDSYRNLLEESRDLLEEVKNEYDSNDLQFLKSKLQKIANFVYTNLLGKNFPWDEDITKIENIDDLTDYWEFLIEDLENYLVDLESKIAESEYVDNFRLNSTLITLQGHDSVVVVKTRGDISPERGSSDTIIITALKDSYEVANGEIYKQYGEYAVEEDTGLGIATHEDLFWVSLKDITADLSEFSDCNLKHIEQIRDRLHQIFN